LRTAYLGTSDFAATVLRRLAASPHAPALVVTPPDSRQGRGRKEAPPPAAEAARELGLELLQVADVNEAGGVAALRAASPDVVAVCAFGQLLGEPLLDEHRMLNVHPSLIPRWRGAAPIERAIMAGVELEADAHDRRPGLAVALQEPMPIEPGDYYDDLAGRLAEQGGELLVRALDLEQAGELELSPQDDAAATYAEKIDPSERRLDPARGAAELAWTVRALNPHVGTHIELPDGERLGVRRARPVEDAPPQGAIRFDEEAGVLVLGTAQAGLGIETVQAPGKRPMGASEFARGNPVPERAV